MAESSIAALRKQNFSNLYPCFSSLFRFILQRGGTFRIFVPFCGTLLKSLSGKGLGALFPKFCRILRPKRSTPFYFAVSRFLFSPKKLHR